MNTQEFTGKVTTFFNPDLFWFIYDSDLFARNTFTQRFSKFSLWNYLDTAEEGQKILIRLDEHWLRAEVVDIKQAPTFKNLYICWLLDYGYFVENTNIFRYPKQFENIPYFVRKYSLYGLISTVQKHDFVNATMTQYKTNDWTCGIRTFVIDILNLPNSIQTLRKRFKINENMICDLIITTENEQFNLVDKIENTGFAKRDLEAFVSDFQKKKHITLSTVFNKIGTTQNPLNMLGNKNLQNKQLQTGFDFNENYLSDEIVEYSRHNEINTQDLPNLVPKVNWITNGFCFGRGIYKTTKIAQKNDINQKLSFDKQQLEEKKKKTVHFFVDDSNCIKRKGRGFSFPDYNLTYKKVGSSKFKTENETGDESRFGDVIDESTKIETKPKNVLSVYPAGY